MANRTTVFWENQIDAGVPRRDQRSGDFHPYLPDPLIGAPLALDAAADTMVAQAERAVLALNDDAHDLAGIARFLLRSEAIASSRIEGIAPSAKQVALAELGQTEVVVGVSDPARLVANNMTIVQEATSRLLMTELVTVDEIVALHRALLPDEPHHHGLRTAQNWIGAPTGTHWKQTLFRRRPIGFCHS